MLLGIAAGTGGEAADDFAMPGTESQQALDLFQAHSPAFAGADSTLVFTVEDGKITDPGPQAAIEARAGQGPEARGRAPNGVGDPFAEGGAISPDGKLASVDVRYITDPNDIDKADGEALLEAGESAERRRRRRSPRAAC